ncbi:MAG: ATP-binding domain-containing protein [Patescibacteria group bacterium]|nr:ATP-binding domain-containing protein [Patescibacteria group bacterium]
MVKVVSKPPLAGAWLNGNLHWYGGGKRVAVITPTLGAFAKKTVEWASKNRTKKGSGPYSILWEESEAKASASFLSKIALQDVNDIPSIITLLTDAGDFRVSRDICDWMDKQRRTRAKINFSKDEIKYAIEQCFARRRMAGKGYGSGWSGMTVHGAKNREFENVVVLWPAAISGSDDQKRRLLYNAVTRAKDRCLVLVEAQESLNQAPFA